MSIRKFILSAVIFLSAATALRLVEQHATCGGAESAEQHQRSIHHHVHSSRVVRWRCAAVAQTERAVQRTRSPAPAATHQRARPRPRRPRRARREPASPCACNRARPRRSKISMDLIFPLAADGCRLIRMAMSDPIITSKPSTSRSASTTRLGPNSRRFRTTRFSLAASLLAIQATMAIRLSLYDAISGRWIAIDFAYSNGYGSVLRVHCRLEDSRSGERRLVVVHR